MADQGPSWDLNYIPPNNMLGGFDLDHWKAEDLAAISDTSGNHPLGRAPKTINRATYEYIRAIERLEETNQWITRLLVSNTISLMLGGCLLYLALYVSGSLR